MNTQQEYRSSNPPAVNISCAKILTKTCADAFDLYEEQKELEQIEISKTTTNMNIVSADSRPDLEANFAKLIDEKSQVVTALQKRINSSETLFIKDAADKLYAAISNQSNLESVDFSSLAMKEVNLQTEPYANQIKQLIQRAENLVHSKSDTTNLARLEDYIAKTKDYLENREGEIVDEYNRNVNINNTILELWSAVLDRISSDKYKEQLKENIEREMLGLPSIEEERKELAQFEFSQTVQKSLSNFLRDQFWKELAGITRYPKSQTPKQKKKNKKRPRTLTYVSAKSKSVIKSLNLSTALISRNLDSKGMKKTYQNITTYYNIAKSQEDLMNFISGPNDERQKNHNKLPADLQNYVPPQCNLYEKNIRLSSAMATSIAQYTENTFSDLSHRIAALEKRL